MPDSPLHVDDAPCTPEVVAQVKEALEGGRLVVLPTETVYGIAARADQPAALEALSRAKGRPDDTPFTWHVGDTSCLDALGARTPPVERLVERYWPGPLTLVLPDLEEHLPHLASQGRVGVRLPAHRATASILSALPFPVAMTSANIHGEDPVSDPALLPTSISDAIALCVEGGAPRPGGASTVLRIGRASGEERWCFELLREGLHDLEALRRTAGRRIMFVCTGNTCRSPIAEGLARRAVAQRLGCEDAETLDFGFEFSSAGTFAFAGGRASQHSLEQLDRRGVNLSDHRAREASPRLLEEADLIYCLARPHLDAVRSLLPPDRAETAMLLDPTGGDIPDPIGGSSAEYERCADRIASNIEAHLGEWL